MAAASVRCRKRPVCEIVHQYETACTTTSEENAAFIVQAVNAHDALMAALDSAEDDLSFIIEGHDDLPDIDDETARGLRNALHRIRAALKLARGDA